MKTPPPSRMKALKKLLMASIADSDTSHRMIVHHLYYDGQSKRQTLKFKSVPEFESYVDSRFPSNGDPLQAVMQRSIKQTKAPYVSLPQNASDALRSSKPREKSRKNLCQHGTPPSRCSKCVPRCIHNKTKGRCRECPEWGGLICAHGKRKECCIICSPQFFCPHNKMTCKKCIGTVFCEHGKKPELCRKCKYPTTTPPMV